VNPVGTEAHKPGEASRDASGPRARNTRELEAAGRPHQGPGLGKGCVTVGPPSGTPRYLRHVFAHLVSGLLVGSPHDSWKIDAMFVKTAFATRSLPDMLQPDLDWLESQEFPTRPVLWNGNNRRDSTPEVETQCDECTADWLASQEFPTRGIVHKPPLSCELQMEGVSTRVMERVRRSERPRGLMVGASSRQADRRTGVGI
jgi:hypothetical protein